MNQQPRTHSGITVRNFTLILTALSAVIWMGTSIFIPGLPEIGRDLGINNSQLSTILTLYFVSFSIMMIAVGPLSDAWGRRGFILAGLGLFMVGSIACGLADGVQTIYFGRIIQGLGVGMIQVPTLAMVRDECQGTMAYTVLGLLGALTGIIPVLSMLVGGLVIEFTGWRPVFFILAACAGIGIIACMSIPETLRPESRLDRIDFLSSMKRYGGILRSKQVMLVTSPLLLFAFFQGAYLIIAPHTLEARYHMSPALFAVANLLVVGGMVAGQFAATRAVKSFAPQKLYIAGAVPALAGGTLFFGLVITSYMDNVLAFLTPLALLGFSFGFMEPIGIKSLFSRFKETPAMASAMYVSLLLVLQALGSSTVGILMDISIAPLMIMAMVVAPLGVIIIALARAGKKRIQ